MENKNSYKYGLFGRCPICKEIFKIACQHCGKAENFVDSGRLNHVLCQDCGTHNLLVCPKSSCHKAPLQYRTPKNEDEQKRIQLYIEIKKDKSRDNRTFEIKEKRSRSIVQVVEIAADGSYSVPSMKNRPVTNTQSFDFTDPILEQSNTGNNSQPVKERRIVNQFYDEIEDEYIDKKTVFEVVYDETVYYNCTICGRVDMKVKCTRCNSSDQFNLNYEALSCNCGNQMKVAICDCGAKQSHQDLFLKSDNVKWQFSRAKSYYDYCKGRMTVFSTCPVCNIFSAEQCIECGSKVNFGLPNPNQEVYCKNCGTINKFKCDNLRCNQSVKILSNPDSTEQKFEWLKKVMNLKKEALRKIAASRIHETDMLPTDFVERIQKKNQDMLSASFITEVAKEVKNNTSVHKTIIRHNRRRLIGPGFYFVVGTMLIIIALLAYEIHQFKDNAEVQKIYKKMINQ